MKEEGEGEVLNFKVGSKEFAHKLVEKSILYFGILIKRVFTHDDYRKVSPF